MTLRDSIIIYIIHNSQNNMRLHTYIKIYSNKTKSQVNELYKNNLIKVNGKIESLLYNVNDNDVITINDEIIERIEYKYYLYYKPIGILSVIDDSNESYINNINLPIKVMPAGRLDKDSEGLLLLTNDGDYINLVCNPKTHFEKEYLVTLKNVITNEFIDSFKKDIILDNKILKPIIIKKIDSLNVSMILTEGIYHEIRRVVKLFNNEVVNLKRIRIGNYHLNDMNPNDLIEISIK